MAFSEKLKDLRKERGISQEELAKVLHITRQSISKWETGAAYPDMEKMKMLSDLYELTLDELMNQESKGASESEKERTEAGEEQEDLEENLIVGGFIIGIGLGLVTGNFLLGTAGGFIGLGLPYIIRAVKKIR
jgi:transcriptional regulator with XRE-family HTH domain